MQLHDPSMAQYYDPFNDQYRLPNGKVIEAWRVDKAKAELRDMIDASRGHDPRNSIGRLAGRRKTAK